jgi:hypothetical protein
MFERTTRLAEKIATCVSRRHFLGSLGRWAGATALAMAGVLTTAGTARATWKHTCCYYGNIITSYCLCTTCVPLGASCPPPPKSWCGNFIASGPVSDCGACKCQ